MISLLKPKLAKNLNALLCAIARFEHARSAAVRSSLARYKMASLVQIMPKTLPQTSSGASPAARTISLALWSNFVNTPSTSATRQRTAEARVMTAWSTHLPKRAG